ncbi:tetratricopeptide repeat protein [Dinoroseobacter sp. S76]|uniref:tetratricopeptide repeat protein n=1 Tax=Dinoroseobacter sp. S76 TaxID=3415124 RepID=UPI003C7DCC3D
MRLTGSVRLMIGVLGVAALAACDTAEERAEEHYQKGLELIEAGDADRALVELRNVFNLNGFHRDARALYAATVREMGRTREAYGQYLRLVEQYPDDLEGRLALANLSIEGRQWEEATRHVTRANELAADDFGVKIVDLVVRYRESGLANDDSTRAALLETALEMLEQAPEELNLHNVLIDGAIWQQDFDLALERVDAALSYYPEEQQLYMLRLAALEQLGDMEGIEEQLVALAKQFPDVERYRRLVLQFYQQRGEPEKAEAFIRSIVSPTDEDPSEYVAFVRYLRDTRGIQAAVDELENALVEAPDSAVLKALQASLIFDSGDRDTGIAQMQAIVDAEEESNDTLRFKVALAQMLLATGNEVGARKLVEETLAADASNVDAIKMQAAWLIDGDETERAISLLRTALDQTPDDPQIMTLIANAHLRNGDRELARDLLSLAADTSSFAPEESLRYAQFLVGADELLGAEDVLVNALRRAPSNLRVLAFLGDVYVRLEDWSRAEHVERTLRQLEDTQATEAADAIRVAILDGQGQAEDALDFLAQLATGEDGNFRALTAAVQSLIAAGEVEQARALVQEAIELDPDRFDLQFLDAALESSAGDLTVAEKTYRDLISREEANERVWVELVRVLNRAGKPGEAEIMLDQGLEKFPDGPNLLWAKASTLEQRNDIEGAIAIYEDLYAISSRSTIVSNNLASLLSTHRGDEASIERAYRIARRLRGTRNPAFQDTYGWLAYQRGRYDEALTYLEPAVAGLPQDPLVRFHLGMTYLAVDRTAEGAEALQTAISLAGPNDTRPQFTIAREELNKLENAGQ